LLPHRLPSCSSPPRRPPTPPLFPYTTLFRSDRRSDAQRQQQRAQEVGSLAVRMPDLAERSPAHRERDHSDGNVDEEHPAPARLRSEEHTSELQSHLNLVCRLLLEKKKSKNRE